MFCLSSQYRCSVLLLLLLCTASYTAQSQIITTLAGGIGNDTTAEYARIYQPTVVTTDYAGNVYVLENTLSSNSVRKLTVASNRVSAVATGGRGVFDAAGNWYYVANYNIKKVSPAGVVSTIAGNGTGMYSGDGGSALLAGMEPEDVAIDGAGNLYFCDATNRRVRKISTTGIITTIAGTGVLGYTGDGGNATSATFYSPAGITADSVGNIYIADVSADVIRKIDVAGTITTVAGAGIGRNDSATGSAVYLSSPKYPRMSVTGELYYCHGSLIYTLNTSGIVKRVAGLTTGSGYSGDGGPATAATLSVPRDIAVDRLGNLYITDYNYSKVRKVDVAGIITTVLGNGLQLYGNGADESNPLLSRFGQVSATIYDTAGNLYIADKTNSKITRINTAGVMSTFAGNGITGFTGDGGPATAASLGAPVSMVFDASGNLYIAESSTNRVRKIATTGIITTVAGGGTVAPGDGGLATNAQLSATDIAIDAHNNLLIVDGANKRLRKVTASTGIITTVAGNGTNSATGDGAAATASGLVNPTGIAIDEIGNIFISGNLVRKIDTAGIITTIPFSSTYIAVDTMGNLYTSGVGVVRRYDIYNYTSVIAGSGITGFSGDNGPATNARLIVSGKISIDTLGRVLIPASNGVRKVCCLSNDIDRPPLFVKGTSSSITFCLSSIANSLDTLLRVADLDTGDNLTWSVLAAPVNGTLAGFPFSTVSTGGTVVPSGLTYTPPPGYTGSATFKIKISDGEDTAIINISVMVSDPPNVGSVYGTQSVCVGDAGTVFSSNRPFGVWSVTNGKATVDTAGRVTGISAGVDTVVYTYPTYCGLVSITRTVTVNELPAVAITSVPDHICKGATVTCNATPAGGQWSATSNVVAGNANGSIYGFSAGTAIITYTYNSTCGIVSDTAHISVIAVPVVGVSTGRNNGCISTVIQLRNSINGGVWGSSDRTVADINTYGLVLLTSPGTTIISYTVTNVCGTATDTMLFTVRDTPDVGVIAGNYGVCVGSSITLTNNVVGVWSTSDSLIASVNPAGVVDVYKSGNVSISYTVNSGCGIGSAVAPLVILPTPQLTPITGKSIVIKGNSVTLRGRAPSGIWSSNNENVLTIDPWGVATGHEAGQAVVTYQEQDPSSGCIARESLLMTVTPVAYSTYSHYPNPASQIVNISYKGSSTTDAQLMITDRAGRVVYNGKLYMPSSSGVATINISALPKGVYTLIIRAADGEYSSRLVVL